MQGKHIVKAIYSGRGKGGAYSVIVRDAEGAIVRLERFATYAEARAAADAIRLRVWSGTFVPGPGPDNARGA